MNAKEGEYDKAKFYYKQAHIRGNVYAIKYWIRLCTNLGHFEKAFLLTYENQKHLEETNLLTALNKLMFPISDENKDKIYSILETMTLPRGNMVNVDLIYIMQDVVSRKVQVMCDIAYYYKNHK